MNRPKGGGVKGAADLLGHLDTETRERLLKEMAEKDPQLTALIKESLYSIEDIKYLTPSMMTVLTRKFDGEALGKALRGQSKEVVTHVLKNVSSNTKKDIEDILNGPALKKSVVQEQQDEILEFIKEKVKSGEIVINKNDDEEYV